MINSIMFHYFYDNIKYKKVQGSISSNDLDNLIKNSNYNIISFNNWEYKYKNNLLNKKDVFLSFDDGLKEQIDIALPVLNKYNLKCLFSINTYPTENGYDKLEVYRYFRNNFFKSIDDFYLEFFNQVRDSSYKEYFLKICNNIDFNKYLYEFKFYTYNDRKFRYVRDEILKDDYFKIMDRFIEKYKIDLSKINLWMDKQDIYNLHKSGHFISLHTHDHPTNLSNLDFEQQKFQIEYNKNFLENIINSNIKCMCYPCGRYDLNTIRILKQFNIDYAFVSYPNLNESQFTLGRIDCVNLLNEVKKFE